MKSNFIQEYERKLVESGREESSLEIARKMEKRNYSRDVILDITGVDILKTKN
ncbi:MAG: hypothetical protein IJL02_10385 [Methanobrevibacter sp.]|uniref:hypothetical protein n=1 Tax=Methanobrevibacter sp. TaxID=66852 RepID=UPI0025FD860D|nr:hypothetical protein [Methanobrevibacter sp.]MBQ6100251.1 hypothetical protein [Methanobrevibacter sp.]